MFSFLLGQFLRVELLGGGGCNGVLAWTGTGQQEVAAQIFQLCFQWCPIGSLKWALWEYSCQDNQQVQQFRFGFSLLSHPLTRSQLLTFSSIPLVEMYYFLRSCQFFKVANIPLCDMWEFQLLHLLLNIWYCQFLILAILVGVWWHLTVVNLHFSGNWWC